jgi:hypothetical protein
MPTVSCEFKLAAERDDPHTLRVSFLDITGSNNRGTWLLSQGSEDPRLRVSAGGEWGVHTDPAGVNTAYLWDDADHIQLQLSELPRDVMRHVTCGFSWSGPGLRTMPPTNAIVYKLTFLCA